MQPVQPEIAKGRNAEKLEAWDCTFKKTSNVIQQLKKKSTQHCKKKAKHNTNYRNIQKPPGITSDTSLETLHQKPPRRIHTFQLSTPRKTSMSQNYQLPKKKQVEKEKCLPKPEKVYKNPIEIRYLKRQKPY